MKKLSLLEEPAVAGVVREKSLKSAAAEIKNCVCGGADMIDLHLSCLDKTDIESLKTVISSSKLPILALNYNANADWSGSGYSEDERAAMFLRAVEAGAAGIDMQGYTFDIQSKNGFHGADIYSFTKGNPKEIVTDDKIIEKQCGFIDEIHSRGAEVLISCHPGIKMNSTQVTELALFLEKRKPDIIKIVTYAENEDDLFESFTAMKLLKREVKTKVSYHANGKAGALSRIINPILGGQIAFCVDRYSESSTMEQLDLRTVRTIIDNIKRL